MIRAVLFDFAGVIGADGYWVFLREKFPDIESHRDYFHEISRAVDSCEISAEEFVGAIASRAAMAPADAEAEILKRIVIFDEVLELLKQLKPHYKIGVLSNFIYEWLHPILERNGIYALLDAAVISTEVRLCKPDPAIFRLAVEKLGVSADAVLFIDDREVNIEAAKRLGMQTILCGEPKMMCREVLQLLDTGEA